MVFASLGSAGMGLVWGWLLILIGSGRQRPARPAMNALALALATILMAGGLFLMTDGLTLLLFLAMAAFSLIMHIAWRHSLRTNQAGRGALHAPYWSAGPREPRGPH